MACIALMRKQKPERYRTADFTRARLLGVAAPGAAQSVSTLNRGLAHGRANDPAGGVAHAGPLAEGRGEATQRVPPSLDKRTPPDDRRDSENAYGT